jgi:hypothetical protein
MSLAVVTRIGHLLLADERCSSVAVQQARRFTFGGHG